MNSTERESRRKRGTEDSSDVGVLALVADRWHQGYWMPRHQVLTRLASHCEVCWVDSPFYWKRWIRSLHGSAAISDEWQTPQRFQVCPTPWYLPKFHRPSWLWRSVYKRHLNRARKMLTDRGCSSIVLYVWRPRFEEALDLVDHDLSCYHIDDEYSFSAEQAKLRAIEVKLLKRVDQVIIHSKELVERKGGFNKKTCWIPNGVDFDLFSRRHPMPADMAEIRRPVIGYCGVLKRQLDWTLIENLARNNPDKSFVLVGGTSSHAELDGKIQALKQLENIHFVGRKSPAELATYPQHFDVCIMPYKNNSYTNAIYPLKLHEYLASGKPVIGTPIRTLCEFDGLIGLPRSGSEWQMAVDRALSADENSDDKVRSRQETAAQHDWNLLVNRIARLLVPTSDRD